MEECFQHPTTKTESKHKDIVKLQSTSSGTVGSDNNSGGFDCNICLDLVQDPVVSFCGHLYCWPCIYRWLQSQKASLEDPDQQPQCPVCKAKVSQKTLIPLYGRGQSSKPSDPKIAQTGRVIPHRPNGPGCGIHTLVAATSRRSSSHPSQQLHYQGGYLDHHYTSGDYPRWPTFGFAGTTTYNPMIVLFGEMICARFFGNSQSTLYMHPNTYYSLDTTASSGRVRRHVMQAETSLSRVSCFLFCCIILCLLLF